jgi:hypothetical protein
MMNHTVRSDFVKAYTSSAGRGTADPLTTLTPAPPTYRQPHLLALFCRSSKLRKSLDNRRNQFHPSLADGTFR